MAASAPTTITRIGEVRTELEGLGEKLGGLRSKERTNENFEEITKLVSEIGFLDHQLKTLQRSAEVELLERSYAAEPEGGPKGGTRQAGPDLRSTGERVIESDEFKAWNGRGSFEIETRALVDSTGGIDWSSATDGPGLLRPLGTPRIPPQTIRRTRLFLRDVLLNSTTALAAIPYIKELNAEAIAGASGAQFVAEGAAKPETSLSFEPDEALVRKIAVWIPATYEALQDAGQLRSYIDQRLTYMVALREEKALLNGSGTAPEIRGLRQQSGKQTQSAVAGDPFATIGRAIGKIEIVDGEANWLAMNPADYWQAVTTRFANQFDGETASGSSPFGAPAVSVWGVPVIRTNAMESLKVLVGSRQGAEVVDREQTVIRVGDQHSDYFVSNKVVVLAEKRLAFPVYRPDWYCETTIAFA